MIDCRSISQFLFGSLVTILMSSRDHDEGISDSFKTLQLSITSLESYNDPTVTNIAEDLDERVLTTTEKLSDSPFHVMCVKELKKLSGKMNTVA